MVEDQELWKQAKKRAEEKAGFFVHFAAYVAVNSFLVLIWWFTTGVGSFPWFVIPMGGWGIGVAIHGVATLAGEGYVERATRREYERMRGREP